MLRCTRSSKLPKRSGLNPQIYLVDVLARVGDYPARHIATLLPWKWKPLDNAQAAPEVTPRALTAASIISDSAKVP